MRDTPMRMPGRLSIWLLAILAMLSVAIAIYPDPHARALVSATGIVVDSGFVRYEAPKDFEVRESILHSPELVTWRTWNPVDGSVPGDAHTVPFHMPRYMAIPYQGFAGDPGIRFYVQCLTSGATLEVAAAPTNTQWSEVLVSRPRNWCKGDSRIVVHSDSHEKYIAFGTPFRISSISWLKTRVIGLFGLFLLLLGAVVGLCLSFSITLRRAWPQGDALALGMIGLGVTGYLLFFAFYFSGQIGMVASIGALLVAAAGLARLAGFYRRAGPAGTATRDSVLVAWQGPLLGWVVVSLSYFLLLYSADSGAGPWLANARFSPARWSSDNQLPMLISEYLVRFKLTDLDLGSWLISDRTPLSYGLHGWLRLQSLWITRGNDGPYLAPFVHTLIGIILNTAWVPVLVHILRCLGLTPRRIAIAVATSALLPFCLFNSIYIWPKLLGGSFGLLAVWVLLVKPREGASESELGGRWVQAAMLSALALLSHGGTVFGIVAMLLVAAFAVPLARVRTLLASGIAAAALLMPWMLWQKFVQPPGNALLKSVFAGTFGFDEKDIGVLETIRRSYSHLTPGTWLTMKADALRLVFLPANEKTCGYSEMAVGGSSVDRWRIDDFMSLVPSIKFLWLGLIVFVMLKIRKQRPEGYRAACLLLGVGLLGIAIDTLAAWDCQLIHTQSYQSILAFIIGLLLFLLKLGPTRFGMLAAASSIAYGVIVWVWDPLSDAIRLDPIALLAYAALAAAVVKLTLRLEDRPPGIRE